jgi:hypothetical protein
VKAETRRREGRQEKKAEALLREAGRRLEEGRLVEAEATYAAADQLLDAQEPEVELIDYPRGLVGYVPLGERGAPPERDEEQLSNRLLLIQRLLTVRRSEGREVDRFLPRLNAAELAYVKGDRVTARRLVDEVHSDLESMGDPPTSGKQT